MSAAAAEADAAGPDAAGQDAAGQGAAERPAAYLIVGAGGMLGSATQRVLTERGAPFRALTENDLDITDETSVFDAVGEFAHEFAEGAGRYRPVVLNAAAYTNVERAEDEPDLAFAVNADGPRILVAACLQHDCRFVHVSTDFVFDGRKKTAYSEIDKPNPLSVYGASKLEGERRVAARSRDALVVRTAWVFGSNGVNFVVKILSAARDRGSVAVVTDEVGSPTYTLDLAAGIVSLERTAASGLFHLAGAGHCSRHELALEALRVAGLEDVPVEATVASAYPAKAVRPKNSMLDCGKAAALGVRMPEWRDGLERFIAETGQ